MDESNIPAEIVFAQYLAANEKVKRDRALRRLKKYLYNHSSLPHGGFDETELLKIWKGLHYCMWMQDKPLIQEELSANIASLIHSFNNSKTALLFIKTFYKTECREWNTIDKWRMDKFLMLFRNMLSQSLEFLKQRKWGEKLVTEFLDFLSSYILSDHLHDTSPEGLRFHLADTYLPELEAVSAGELGPKHTITLLQPWVHMLSGLKNKTLRAFVIKNVFGTILMESPIIQGRSRKKGSKKLRVNYQMMADKLLAAGSSEECLAVNRAAIYNLVQNFRDVAADKLPFAPEDEEEEEEPEDLCEEDIENAVQRLTERNQQIIQESKEGKRLSKKKRKLEAEEDEAYVSELSGEEESLPNKKHKKNEPDDKTMKKKKNDKSGILSKKLQAMLKADEEFAEEEEEEDEEEYEAEKEEEDNSDADEVEMNGEDEDTEEDEDIGSESDVDDEDINDEFLYADDDELSDMGDDMLDDSDEEKVTPESATKLKKQKAGKKSNSLNVGTESTKVHKTGNTNGSQNISSKTDTKRNGHGSEPAPVKKANKSNKHETQQNRVTNGGTTNKSAKNGQVEEKLNHDKPKPAVKSKKVKKAKKEKTQTNSAEFDVEDFPESDAPDISEFSPSDKQSVKATKPQEKRKRSGRKTSDDPKAQEKPVKADSKSKEKKPVKADSKSKEIAHFLPTENTPQAKYFKKASSKRSPTAPRQATSEQKTPPKRVDKKRLSFGRNSSVKKTAVKLRGSSSYDPSRTPEQGILRVNPIQPGTVIQVGKQATIKNTLKNSKYPQRMMAMDFF